MCPCAHICLVASSALALGHIAIIRMDFFKQPIPQGHQGLSSPLSSPPSYIHLLERNLCLRPWYADPLCCPRMPSLLMEGLASPHLSHGQFILVDRVSQANIYSGPKPLGRAFYNINGSSQWGGLFSSSSLPFGIGARGLWDGSMAFLCKVQCPPLGQLGSPTIQMRQIGVILFGT